MEEVHEDDMEPERKKLKVESVETVKGTCMQTDKTEVNDDIIDWLQSLNQFYINVSYHILVASLTLMALS